MAENSPDASGSSGNAIVVGACVLALVIVAVSFLIKNEVERINAEILDTTLALRAASGRAGEAPSIGPDPRQRLDVAVGEAPIRGPKTAKITIVEWSDFECPFCERVVPTLERIRDEYDDDVQLAFKHLPLPMHRNAGPAHRAAEAANRQGKFWEMHDKLFENRRQLSDERYLQLAEEISLDIERFERDLVAEQVQERIDQDVAQATALGVRSTPAFFVNGRFLSGAKPFAAFKVLIDEELARY